MSSQPANDASSVTAPDPGDPVVGIFEAAGLVSDPGVHACAALAAGAHRDRFADGTADAPALNRSTFLWSLWRSDATVRSALDRDPGLFDRFAEDLGIRRDPEPLTGPFELAAELTRALQAFAEAVQGTGLTVTPALLGLAVLEDVQLNGGLLGDRLRSLGIDVRHVVQELRPLVTEQPPALVTEQAPAQVTGAKAGAAAGSLVAVRELSPRRFGVHLAPGSDQPGRYVARDVDQELDRALTAMVPVVAVLAAPHSGATRTIFEGLRRARPDDSVLLAHELLDAEGRSSILAEDLDRLWDSGAGVIWVRDLVQLLDGSPVFEDWFRQHRADLAATLVVLLRPEDEARAAELGLTSNPVIELGEELSVDEQERARTIYGRDIVTVAAIAMVVGQADIRANYAADSAAAAALVDEHNDDLDIRADVAMIAKLIASKDVEPPLSIGVFGPWGSGKSYLLRQVQLRIDDLASRSRRQPAGSTGYLSEIVSVDFNAWQYAHGSALWASLITRVFEGIQEQLGDDDRYLGVLRDVAAKNAAVADAHRKLTAARANVKEKRAAESDRPIKEVADRHAMTQSQTATLAESLDLDVVKSQVSDVRHEMEALSTTGARLRKGWSTASPTRRATVVTVVVLGLLLVALVALVPSLLQQLTALVAAVGALATAVMQVLRPVNRGLAEAASLLGADDADKEALRRAEQDVSEAEDELAAARTSGLAGLYDFVSDRSTATEYTRELGMAPTIRDDLRRLAELSESKDGLPGIDRIVIFIDDLDRCPSSEVVRVLEAVNLLFGFSLFVVVVAVDSRWLVRSLEGTFSEAFDADDGSAPTPQNYLEKIIQIPFWLRAMQPKGFERLVTTLAGEVDDGGGDNRGEGGGPPGADPGVDAASHGAGDGDDPTVSSDGPTAAATPQPPPPVASAVTGQEEDPAVPSLEDDLTPKALRLTKDERDCLMRFLPLVETPRAVKRFLNTYQLLRVSVTDVDGYLSRREYQPVLVLLALMTGTMSITDSMTNELRNMTDASFADFLTRAAATPETGSEQEETRSDWTRVQAACDGLPTAALTPAVIKDWMPKVARYSFHPMVR